MIIGIVPARMASTRFPGKPLHPICGRPMIEHVFRRTQLFERWDGLYLATCDKEIAAVGHQHGWPVVMTADTHTRALDRVAEAAAKCGQSLAAQDIVVCVQGDEPMLHPEMIAASIKPLEDDPSVPCTVLAMEITDEDVFRDPNTVKIVHDKRGDVLYTSRSPVPYCKVLTPAVGARRIYGIFAFRWHFLNTFTSMTESPLELVESCDSNRICDNGFKQRVAPYPYVPSFSVDSPSDTVLVESHMRLDPWFGRY